jgi:hypothetical protein
MNWREFHAPGREIKMIPRRRSRLGASRAARSAGTSARWSRSPASMKGRWTASGMRVLVAFHPPAPSGVSRLATAK